MARKSGRPLSNKQRAFVEHYLQCWNASEAARLAGYTGRSNTIGHRLLTNVDISEAIKTRLASLQMSADEVLTRLTRHARGSMGDFLIPETGEIDLVRADEAGKLDLIKTFRRTITTVSKLVTKETITVELYDAQNALIQLGRTHGLFVDKLAPTTPDGKGEFTGTTPDDRALAALELAEWQRQQKAQIESLSSSSSAPATPPTS